MYTLNLPENLFWDIDLDKFDNIQNQQLIIERVMTMGDLPDIRTIVRFYGIETIKQEIVKAAYLDNKTLAWASNILNIPKSKFKCFTKKQSNQAHWNY